MNPVHALWIKRGETLADLILALGRFLSRIRGMSSAPVLPIDPAAAARRSAEIAVAMRNGRQLRSDTLRHGTRLAVETVRSEAEAQAKATVFNPRMAERAPARYRSSLYK
jgi:hypothetical protein